MCACTCKYESVESVGILTFQLRNSYIVLHMNVVNLEQSSTEYVQVYTSPQMAARELGWAGVDVNCATLDCIELVEHVTVCI